MILKLYYTAISLFLLYIFYSLCLFILFLEWFMERQDVSRFVWKWGFTVSAENWNGRLAMLGFFLIVIIEMITGKGILHFLGIV